MSSPPWPSTTTTPPALARDDDAGRAPAPAKKAEKGKKVEVAVPTMPTSNATDALNRVTIPQEAIDRISALMSPGASLIISDKGISGRPARAPTSSC
jgi:hypothetical protein